MQEMQGYAGGCPASPNNFVNYWNKSSPQEAISSLLPAIPATKRQPFGGGRMYGMGSKEHNRKGSGRVREEELEQALLLPASPK